MINNQPPVPRVKSEGRSLLVHSIFHTIQGEGPYAGRCATFVRLAGCNLQCPLCDTEYTEGARVMSVLEIVREVGRSYSLVVLTGGEPMRQDLMLLIRRLHSRGFTVQIETNGKFPAPDAELFNLATVVVSPKTATIDEGVARNAAAFKYVISHDSVASDLLPVQALGHPVPKGKTIARPPYGKTVYVNPADHYDSGENVKNMEAAVAAVRYNPCTRILGVQIHKLAELE